MPDLSLPISMLPPALPLDGTELYPCVQGGQTRRTLLPNVAPPVAVFSGATVTATALTLPHDTTTIITWQTAEGDTDGYWNLLSPTRLTAPFDGYYRLTTYGFASLSGDSSTEIFIVQNPGGTILGDGSSISGPSFGEGGACNADGQTVRVTAGTYWHVHLFYDDATDRNWTLRASIQYLGDQPTPPPADLAFDNFVDADGTDLTAHTMPIGAGWRALREIWATYSNLADGRDSGNNSFQWYDTDVSVADCRVQALIRTLPSTGDGGSGLLLRSEADQAFWLVDLLPGGGDLGIGALRLLEWNGGAVVRQQLDIEVLNDTVYAVEARCEGPTITVTLNAGARMVYAAATYNQTKTRFGIAGRKHVGLAATTLISVFRVSPL